MSSQLLFQGIFSKNLVVQCDQESTSSDGGIIFAKNIMDRFKIIDRMSTIIHDDRDQTKVRHDMQSLIGQRVYQLFCGYEDVNDSDFLKTDPLLQTVVDEKNPGELASTSTVCRLENGVNFTEAHKLYEMQLDLYMERNAKRLKKLNKKNETLVIDLDPTDVVTHGNQQMSLFNGYYGNSCYLPLVIADGDNGDIMMALLRPGNKHATFLLIPILRRLFKKIEDRYSKLKFHIRADSGFQSFSLFDYFDSKKNLKYIIALIKNSSLESFPKQEITENGRFYGEFGYKADSWSKYRKVIFQIEKNSHQEQTRYYVTNLTQSPKDIKENYNHRAQIENRIKELKTQAYGSRTSCHTFRANTFRFILSTLCFIVFQELRKKLEGTSLAQSYVSTIREKLIKVAAIIKRSTRRIVLHLPLSYPYQDVWRHLQKALC